jgi:tetratricopeptide (TPR) repeat protein
MDSDEARALLAAMPEHVDVRPRFDAWLELRPLVPQIDALSEGVEPGHPLADVVAQLQRCVGWALMGFEDCAGALPRYERALALRLAADPDGLETARSHQDVGHALTMLSRSAEARPHLERALELRRRVRDDDPELVWLLISLIWNPDEKLGAARLHAEEALALSMRLFGKKHPQTASAELIVADSLRLLAKFPEDEDEDEERHEVDEFHEDDTLLRARADRHRDAALRILDDPNLAPSWEAVEALMGVYLSSFYDEDRRVSLRPAARAVDMAEALLGNEHPKLASVVMHLGWARERAGDFEGAESSFERALAILDRGRDKLAADALVQLELSIHKGLADAREALGRHAAARASYERALELNERRPPHGSTYPMIQTLLDGLAQALGGLGELAAARARYEEATNVEVARPDAYPVLLIMAMRKRGAALLGFGDPEGAVALFVRAEAVLEASSNSVWRLDDFLHEIAKLLLEHEALEPALAYHERLLALRLKRGIDRAYADPKRDEGFGVGAITRTIADLRTRIAAARTPVA